MSYGRIAYGEAAYADAEFPSISPSGFAAFLAETTAERCWLMEIDAFSLAVGSARSGAYADGGAYGETAYAEGRPTTGGGPRTLRYSTHGYISTLRQKVAYLSLPGVPGNYASTPSDDVARNDYAMQFDGAEWIEVSDSSALDLTDNLTIECWAKQLAPLTGLYAAHVTFKGAPGAADCQHALYWFGSTSGQENLVQMFGSPGGAWQGISQGIVLSIGVDYHIVFRWNSVTGGTLHVNGVSAGAAVSAGAGALPVNANPITIGTLAGAPSSCIIDGYRMYSRYISDAEIAEHYAGTFNSAANLVCRLDFEQGVGTKTYDGSSIASAVTTTGTPAWVAGIGNSKGGVVGDIDIRVKAAMDDWTPADYSTFVAKDSYPTQIGFTFKSAPWGALDAYWSTDGTPATAINRVSSVAISAANGVILWVRVTLDVDNGFGLYELKFYTSVDGGTWTQLGDTLTGAVTSIFDSTQPIEIGVANGAYPLTGKIYAAEVRNGIDGPVVAKFDSLRANDGDTVIVADTGEIWTINQTGGSPAKLVNLGEVATSDPDSADWYDGRLTSQIIVDRRIVKQDSFVGLAQCFAEAQLINADGALDTLARDYALDGRRVTILLGRPDDARADFGVVFSGVISSLVTTLSDVRLQLSDGYAMISLPIQTTVYAGSGGLEGGADLSGRPKPLCYGTVFGIAPPLVDAANLIYQVHAGAIKGVPAVEDRGISLAKVAGAPAAGQYQVDISAGTFKLGAMPSGTVTCNVEGDTSLSGYIDRTSDIVLRILATKAALTGSGLDPSSFAALNTDAGQQVGIWIGTEARTIADVVDELLAGIGAFGGFSRLGYFTVGLVAAAAGKADASLTQEDIIDISREPLPQAVEPVVWRTNVGYQKNYTVQTDLAAAVTAAQRAFAAQPIRVASYADASIQSRHLLAQEFGPTPSLYINQADADTEAQRLFDLWSTGRAPYRVTTRPPALQRDIGDVVHVEHPRHGLALGADGRVIGYTAKGTAVELLVLI